MTALKLKTAATEEPLTLAEARMHLKVDPDVTAEDSLIASLIVAARNFVENYTGRALVTQTWEFYLDAFPVGRNVPIRLDKPRLQSVTAITYYDTDNALQTWATALWEKDGESEPARIRPVYGETYPETYDRLNAIKIEYVCGYGAAAAVPENLKAAMKLLIGHWYNNREEVVTGTIATHIQMAAEALMAQERVFRFV